ncbi:YjbH domain-containing protein [Yoonia sp. 2307UL14-13]|uniref:YjbH domain-containing protein n=1 Tax=Yoonia sp. 2307UL14-13 TaxID=3126506 RepID=UPI0030A782DD
MRSKFGQPLRRLFCASAALVVIAPTLAIAEPERDYTYTLYGTPGLIDMPTAQGARDAELATTLGYFGGSLRTTITFQINPRLTGSFRYSRIDDWETDGSERFDRSFDLRYRFIDEGPMRPAVAIGLQDFAGTGIYSGEYLVATKQIIPSVAITGGIGWGRLGSYDSFENPLSRIDDRFADRRLGQTGTGGQVEFDRFFRGDAALFGGISWRPTNRLSFKAEYSSDAYTGETKADRDLFTRDSPWNFGVSYALGPNATAQAYSLYGSEVGVALTFTLNPKEPAVKGGLDQRPTPVVPRAPRDLNNLEWTTQADAPKILRESMQTLLESEGMTLEAIRTTPRTATVYIRNRTYLSGAQAFGRTARMMSQAMPSSIETFTIVPVVGGVRTSAVTIRRSDLERLEFAPDNAWETYIRTQIGDAADAGAPPAPVDDLYPAFTWQLGPYIATTYFDPNNPVAVDVGAELAADYVIAPGLVLSGALRKRVAGDRSDDPGPSGSLIEPVRTNGPLYVAQGDPAITRLTAAYQFNVAPDYYGRITAGYLERMYGGMSTELLWKPVESRLGLGVEVNYARQRDFDQQFGFQDYDIVTGHVSAYYDFANNWHAQVDVGRYLAGDYGATFGLDREFDNGWRVGGFATFTDVSFDDFGEGSFDKGIRFSVPLTHFIGAPSRRVYSATVRPLVRDGGARLNVPGRLYETVRDHHQTQLRDSWGRFWR